MTTKMSTANETSKNQLKILKNISTIITISLLWNFRYQSNITD